MTFRSHYRLWLLLAALLSESSAERPKEQLQMRKGGASGHPPTAVTPPQPDLMRTSGLKKRKAGVEPRAIPVAPSSEFSVSAPAPPLSSSPSSSGESAPQSTSFCGNDDKDTRQAPTPKPEKIPTITRMKVMAMAPYGMKARSRGPLPTEFAIPLEDQPPILEVDVGADFYPADTPTTLGVDVALVVQEIGSRGDDKLWSMVRQRLPFYSGR